MQIIILTLQMAYNDSYLGILDSVMYIDSIIWP